MSRALMAACLGVALACAGGMAEAKTKHPTTSKSSVKAKGKQASAKRSKVKSVVRSAPAVSASEATAASTERLVAEFAPFVGSRGDTESLVTTLRSGRATSDTGPAGHAPATGPMGYGEVRLALKLAQGALKQQGVTAPTPEQISAALHGGRLLTEQGEQTLPGVLPQRQQGAGWAAMAQEYGLSTEDMMPPPRSPAARAASASATSHAKAKAAKGGKSSKAAKTAKAKAGKAAPKKHK